MAQCSLDGTCMRDPNMNLIIQYGLLGLVLGLGLGLGFILYCRIWRPWHYRTCAHSPVQSIACQAIPAAAAQCSSVCHVVGRRHHYTLTLWSRTLIETSSLLCPIPPPLHSNCSKLVHAGLAGRSYTHSSYWLQLLRVALHAGGSRGGGGGGRRGAERQS